MGSTGPMLFTYTAVSITVGLTETSQKMHCTEMISIHFCTFFCIGSKELKQTPCHYTHLVQYELLYTDDSNVTTYCYRGKSKIKAQSVQCSTESENLTCLQYQAAVCCHIPAAIYLRSTLHRSHRLWVIKPRSC